MTEHPLYLGLDLSPEYTQLSYYKLDEGVPEQSVTVIPKIHICFQILCFIQIHIKTEPEQRMNPVGVSERWLQGNGSRKMA